MAVVAIWQISIQKETQKQKREILNLEEKIAYFTKKMNKLLGINQDIIESEIESTEDDLIEIFD